MNLSNEEIQALAALDGKPAAVDGEMVKLLLARARAYQEHGVAGIAPYARSRRKSVEPADDLRSAGKAGEQMGLFDSSVYDTLINYPTGEKEIIDEAFRWAHYTAHGEPTLMLIHAFSTHDPRALVAVQRQYYVSRGYNVEQAVAAFAPVTEGTIVVYTNHTSTDQVDGFGGSAKRSIGEKLMLSQLQALFEGLLRIVWRC